MLRGFVEKRPRSALVGAGRFFFHASRIDAKYRRPAPITSTGLIKNAIIFLTTTAGAPKKEDFSFGGKRTDKMRAQNTDI